MIMFLGTNFFYGAREFYQCIHPGRSIPSIDVNVSVKR